MTQKLLIRNRNVFVQEEQILQPINQSINIFNVLGANWNPTDKKFQFSEFIQSKFASYMQSIP